MPNIMTSCRCSVVTTNLSCIVSAVVPRLHAMCRALMMTIRLDVTLIMPKNRSTALLMQFLERLVVQQMRKWWYSY